MTDDSTTTSTPYVYHKGNVNLDIVDNNRVWAYKDDWHTGENGTDDWGFLGKKQDITVFSDGSFDITITPPNGYSRKVVVTLDNGEVKTWDPSDKPFSHTVTSTQTTIDFTVSITETPVTNTSVWASVDPTLTVKPSRTT